MSAEKYESPPLEVTIARAYQDRTGRYRPRSVGHLRRVVIYNGDGYYDEMLADLLDDAMDQGTIDQQEWEEAWSIHAVLRGEDRQDGSVAYATVDIAITVEDPGQTHSPRHSRFRGNPNPRRRVNESLTRNDTVIKPSLDSGFRRSDWYGN